MKLNKEAYDYVLKRLLETQGKESSYNIFINMMLVMEEHASPRQKENIRLELHKASIAKLREKENECE